MTRHRMNARIFSGLYLVLTLSGQGQGECPADTARRAQQCFTDLAKGVAATEGSSMNGGVGGNINGQSLNPGQGSRSQAVNNAVPLDYRKIREYCAEDGHMPRFLNCVEEISQQCPDLPPEGALRQLINPQRVRTSVPNLCNNVDEVEAGSECMNKEMNKRSPCKDRAYNTIKSGVSLTASNNTAMFFLQCRFFSVLAECQGKAVSEKCGGNLGDLHADFLLSFVPNICISNTGRHFPEGQDQIRDLGTKESRIDDLKKDIDHHQNEESDTEDHHKTGNRFSDLQGNGHGVNEGTDDETHMNSAESSQEADKGKEGTQLNDKTQNGFDKETNPRTPSRGDDINQQVLKTLPVDATTKRTPIVTSNQAPSGPSKISIFSTACIGQCWSLLLLSLILVAVLNPLLINI